MAGTAAQPQLRPLVGSAALAGPRRAVWGLVAGVAGGASLAAAGTVAYLWPRRALERGDAGAVAEYGVGEVRYFGADLASVSPIVRSGHYVVRRADGFVAFVALCAHQVPGRCRLGWSRRVQPEGMVGRFFCPCHGGEWSQETGEPITTPPPFPYSYIPHHVPALPLVSLPVRVAGGRVRVDLYAGAKERQAQQPPLVARV